MIYSLIFPVQEFFQLNPEAAEMFIDEITRDFRLPHSVKEMIFALLNGEVDRARIIAECSDPNSVQLSAVPKPENQKRSEIRDVINGISRYILNEADTKNEARLWPSDYRLFSTNPLNIAYGAAGTALFLKAALGSVPEHVQQWLGSRSLSLDAYRPGLFAG